MDVERHSRSTCPTRGLERFEGLQGHDITGIISGITREQIAEAAAPFSLKQLITSLKRYAPK